MRYVCGVGGGLLIDLRDGFIQKVSRFVHNAFQGKGANEHVGQFFANGIEIGDGLPELATFQSVGNALPDGGFASTQHRRSQFKAPDIQAVEGNGGTIADGPQHILHRYLNLIQNNVAGGRTVKPQFVLFLFTDHSFG